MSDEDNTYSDDEEWLDLDLGLPNNDIKTAPILNSSLLSSAVHGERSIQERPTHDFGDVEATVDRTVEKRSRLKITSVDRKIRLQIHQLHLLCLTYHLCTRNTWCNDNKLNYLVKYIPPGIRVSLHPSSQKSQMIRNKTFLHGLAGLVEVWKRKYKITTNGLRKPNYGLLQNNSLISESLSLEEFCKNSKLLSGSRDYGTQLFASILRNLNVPTRLVFSLQVLSFRFKGAINEASTHEIVPTWSQQMENDSSSDISESEHITSRFRKRRKIIQPSFSNLSHLDASDIVTEDTKLKVIDSPKPVFWVEAFNKAMQKWVCVDPFGDASVIGKYRRFEPASSDHLNQMTYVFAIEANGYVKDVTRKYCLHYYKILKNRVEIFPFGKAWMNRIFSKIGKPRDFYNDMDAIEDAELLRLEQSEGIPRNIQDLKDHPLFVLERHLKKNQAIKTGKSCGRINTKNGVELVYPRKYVSNGFSAEHWYRKGRIIKPGAQPLKHVKNGDKVLPLYDEEATQLYTPKPVVANIVPKNAYGNIDLYVPSMLPYGAYHCRKRCALAAAKFLEIDYAKAVVGFDFQRKYSKPKLEGVVVSKRYEEAINLIAEEIDQEEKEAEARNVRKTCLLLWKRLITGLRIRQRVFEEYG